MVPRDKQVQKRSSFPLTSLLVPPSKAASVFLKRFSVQSGRQADLPAVVRAGQARRGLGAGGQTPIIWHCLYLRQRPLLKHEGC